MKKVYWCLRRAAPFALWFRFVWDPLKTQVNKNRYARRRDRNLEIGCSGARMPGFETLSIVGGPRIDYVLDASKPLPFPDNTFDLIYASHVLEHMPWFESERILGDWYRVLKKDGCLEVWVPDAGKIVNILIETDEGTRDSLPDNWRPHNPNANPYMWVAGRLFWGGNPAYPSWHRALFTCRYLEQLFRQVGFVSIGKMSDSEYRSGLNHGWINLGVRGVKP